MAVEGELADMAEITGVFPYNCDADTLRAINFISSREADANSRIIWLYEGADCRICSSLPNQLTLSAKPVGISQFCRMTPNERAEVQREIDRLSMTFHQIFLLFANALNEEDVASAPIMDRALVIANTEPGVVWSAIGLIGKLHAWQPALRQELVLLTPDDVSVAKQTYKALQNLEVKALPQPFPRLYGMLTI